MRNATLTGVLLLAGITLASGGCATAGGGEGPAPYVTVYVDNLEGEPLAFYVTVKGQTIGRDDACSVPRHVSRFQCRVGWMGTGTVVVEATLQNTRETHSAELDEVSGGNQLCAQVRNTGVQLRRC